MENEHDIEGRTLPGVWCICEPNCDCFCCCFCHFFAVAVYEDVMFMPITTRLQGRPKSRWDDNVKQDISKMKIKIWTVCVQDRGKWRDVVEKAKTFNI
jgi:hypothetical protein